MSIEPRQSPHNETESEIEGAVLDYLHTHPHAADTLDGITRWWLPQQRYVNALSRIETVLHRLVDQGNLQLRRLPDGTVLYSLDNPRPPSSPN